MSIHSIKKAEYARRLAKGRLGHVSLFDHFRLVSTHVCSPQRRSHPPSDLRRPGVSQVRPRTAQLCQVSRRYVTPCPHPSLPPHTLHAGYSLVTYFLQIKDRHNGNILLDRDGHLIHIDFGFMLSNSPGNIGFEAAPFKLPLEYIEVLGGVNSGPYLEFRRLFRDGFEAARKHCDRIVSECRLCYLLYARSDILYVALVELMQKGEIMHSLPSSDADYRSMMADSSLPCFAALGDQTAAQLRERFQQGLTQTAVEEHVNRLIETSLGSNWTRLYDSVSRSFEGFSSARVLTPGTVSVLFAIDILRLLWTLWLGVTVSVDCALHTRHAARGICRPMRYFSV